MLGCDWPGVTSSLSSVVDFTSGFEQSGGQASAHAGSGCPRWAARSSSPRLSADRGLDS